MATVIHPMKIKWWRKAL